MQDQKRALNEQNALDPGKYQFVDLYALTLADALGGRLLSGDQLHPNAAGYTIYADKVYNAIFNEVYAPAGFYLTDVYLSASGSATGAGTAGDPISLLPVALGRMADNGRSRIPERKEITGPPPSTPPNPAPPGPPTSLPPSSVPATATVTSASASAQWKAWWFPLQASICLPRST